MRLCSTRVRNRLLQMFYRPRTSGGGLFALPSQTLSALDQIENSIEEKITPLLSELFN